MSAPYISEIVYRGNVPFDSYLVNLPLIKHFERSPSLKLESNVTFFVGENGTGKSTLLEAIAVAFGFNAEGGTVNFNFSTNDTHSPLYKSIRLIKRGFAEDGFFLRAESLYNVATNMDELDKIPAFSDPISASYGGSLHKKSHGESFLSIVQNRFSGRGLYILDEPESALSPMKLLTLMAEMDALIRDDSQFIIATHSPILMAFPGAQIYSFSKDGIAPTAYRETEHYKTTKAFLDDPERTLHYLFDN